MRVARRMLVNSDQRCDGRTERMGMLEWWRARTAARAAERERRARIKRGVDEVVTIVDPRLRGLQGYRVRLAPALEKAVAFADELVASLPEPLTVERDRWADDPRLRAFFAGLDDMQAFFDRSREICDFLASAEAQGAGVVFAAIGMQLDRRTGFGMGLQGDVLQRDRQQVSVSFSGHRVGAIAAEEGGFRTRLRRRVLEEIANRAMQRVLGMKTRRDALAEEEATLRWKLKIYEMQRDGMGTLWHGEDRYDSHIRSLRARLRETKTGLQGIAGSAVNIDHFLQATIEEFDWAAETIRVEPLSLHLDAMNVETGPGPGSRELELVQLRVGRRRPRVVQLVRFSPDFVKVDRGLALRRAARVLGVR
jgi:hypothetical protein